MKRGVWLLAGWCLVVACTRGPSAPPVTVEVVPPSAADRPFQEEDIDRMVAIVSTQPAAEPTATPPVTAANLASSQSTTAVTIGQANTPPPPAPTPQPTPRPRPPAPPPTVVATTPPATATATPVLPALPGCPSTRELSDLDGTVIAAQTLPALFYGGSLCAGDKVEALIGGKSCGVTTVNAAGQWSISIRPNAACGPTESAAVALTVNGKPSATAAVWKGGGLPPDVTNGYTLTR